MPIVPFATPDFHLIIQRLPGESERDWQRTLNRVEVFGRAAVTRLPDGSAGLRWEPREAAA
ncbi:hypothetical protein C6W88_19240 [Halomonas litopenaei]|uniref:Uncharacterized protein n=1 Tax=Halomonas litopenaei TaxID=2109328 RepID=A0ABX5IRG6_9GAMM|nr:MULTISPECIES: DUF1654 domain-containing protein [Halomonas]PTL89156.1 hypothetical protein C6W88_19240 [Halomonas litopenaei]PTL89422.1 hypothetical protein C6W89_17950 [Halomonas sp. SYSU XM8]